MVDKTNPEVTDSIAQKSSEELFLRGSEKDEMLRKKADEDDLKLDDSVEELSLQNIQRGSEQREHPNTDIEQTGTAPGHHESLDINSKSNKPVASEIFAGTQNNDNSAQLNPVSPDTGNTVEEVVSQENNDQGRKRVLFNREDEAGQQEHSQPLLNRGEVDIPATENNEAIEGEHDNQVNSIDNVDDLVNGASVNSAPEAGEDVTVTVNEGSPVIDGQLLATDADTGASLSYQVTEGIGIPDGFTLSNDGSWQFDALDSAYDHLSPGDSMVVTVPVVVTDEHGMSDSAQIHITVKGTNDAPVAGASVSTSVDESATSISGQLTSTDLDDGATATFTVSSGNVAPDGFVLNTDGSYSFDPADASYDHLNVGDSKVITIPVTVTDDNGATDTSQIQITISGTNDAPVAGAAVTANVDEGGALISGQLTSADLDDGATATFTVSSGNVAPEGFVLNTDGSYNFDPADVSYDHLNVGDSEVITIPVTVTDDNGATDTSQIQVTVTGTNDAPVAGANVFASVDEGSGSITGQVTTTDVDDGATATFTVSAGSTAPDGFVINADGSYSFDPSDSAYDHLNVGDSEVLTIPVTVTDDNGATDTSQIQIIISGTNDTPVAGAAVTASVDEGSASISGQLTVTDVDDGATAMFTVSSGSTAPDGFVLNTDGSYSFDPADASYDHLNVGDSEVITIPVTVTDDNGATDTSQIQITISGTNDAPVAGAAVTANVDEGGALISGQLTSADLDDGATATFTVSSGNVAPEGFVLNTDGSYNFDPADVSYDHLNVGDSEVITIPVTVTDDNGATDTSQIQITISGTNDAPVAGAAVTANVDEGGALISGQLTSADLDDGATATFTVSSGNVAPEGFVLNTDGSYSFDPADSAYNHLNVGDSEVITVPVTVTDDNGASDVSQIQITVSGTNDAPVAGAAVTANVDEGAASISGQLTSTDLDDGATATFTVSSGNVAPDGFVLNTDGSYSFDPADSAYNHLNAGDSEVITVPVTVTDDDGASDVSQIQITVSGTNDAPVAGAAVTANVDEGGALISGQLTSTDLDDGAMATFTVNSGSTAPDGFVLNTDGSYSFDPADSAYNHLNVGDSEVITVPVTVTDDNGASDVSQIQITVSGTNDAPTAIVFTRAVVAENATASTVVAQMSTQDVDDGESFTYSIVDDVSGLFEVSGDQIIVKAGAKVDFETGASHELSVQVSDANGLTYTQSVTIIVNDTNEAPTDIVFSGDTVDENAAAGTVVATMTTADEDGGETFGYALNDESGLFEISGNQVVVKAGADIDYESEMSHDISVEVTDSAGNTLTENFTINVNDIVENIAPTAVDDVTEGFSPENASLVTELAFEEGVPMVMAGSVTAEGDGQVGSAANFSSAKVEANGLDLNGEAGAQTTVSMWIQANPEGGWEMLAASDRYDMVMLNGDIGFNTARGDLFGTDASELADGEWHHVVGVFTNGDVTQNSIHIDGVAQEMSQIQGTPSSASANIDSSGGSLYFGSWGANNNYRFSGSMDEVKVFDGALSSDEVNSLYDIEAGSAKWDGGALSMQEDNVLIINPSELLANDTDPDGDTLMVSAVQDGDHGTVELDAEGNIQFTPEENYSGEATFSYTVSDGNGGEDIATVTLNVSSVNDLPTIDVVNTVTVDEDGSQQFTYSTADIDSSSVVVTGDAENGNVVVNENGTVTFTPDENYFGDDTIILTATDSNGGVTTQEISVTVHPIEDAPDAMDDGAFEPQSATLAAEINFDEGVPNALLGSVTIESDGQIEGAADFSSAKVEVSDINLNSDAGAQTTVSMWIQANPEGGWEMLAASDRYDMVMLNGDIGFNTARGDMFGTDASELSDGEWHHVVGVFTNGDVTQNSIHIDGVAQEMSQIQGTPSSASANIDSSGGNLYFGSWGANNNYRFSGSMDEVKVFDGVLSSEEISTLHDMELSNNKWDGTSLITDEDVSLVIEASSLLVNDVDVDGDVISIVSVQDAQNGTVEIDGDGNVVFTPDADYYGEASFSYTIDDGKGNTDTATATLNVESINDGITVVLDSDAIANTVSENVAIGSYTGITLDASDVDGDAISYSIEGDVPFSIDANGRVITNGELDFETTESYSVNVTATSADGTTSTNTFMVDVADIEENNEIHGSWRSETINGTEGNDVIYGEGGNDRINAGDGNDVLIGGTGSDTLNGGAGNDTFIQNAGDSNDAFYGGEGNDTVVRGEGDGDIGLAGNFSANNSIETIDAGGNDVVGDWRSQTLDFSETNLENVDEIRGEGGNDKITGTSGDDTIIGGTGSDTLNGGAGNDTFIQNAGDGNDAFYGGEGNDTVVRGEGDGDIGLAGNFSANNSIETIDAGGNDVVGDWRSQTLDFSETNLENVDEIRGEGGNDRITGTSGDDTIIGGTGSDTLNGGAGNDIFIQNAGDGNDAFYGGEGNDTVVRGEGDGDIGLAGNFSANNSIETIDAGGNDVVGDWRSQTLDFSETNLENVDEIRGEGGNDRITGTSGDDTIIGGTGSDTLNGGAGNDIFIQNAGDGNDAFYGGEGNDTVVRGEGDGDIGLAGNFGVNNSIETIDAGGNDVVGDWRSQTLDFSEAKLENVDEIRGEGGNDRIIGSAGDDNISGGSGNDSLAGGEGNDVLSGGSGNDKAYGEDGNDTYVMNPFDGSDYFSGGEGGGWTDAIDVSAVAANDPDSPWSVEVDGIQMEYDIAAGALELNPDTAGVITFGDGSELSFEGVERIEW